MHAAASHSATTHSAAGSLRRAHPLLDLLHRLPENLRALLTVTAVVLPALLRTGLGSLLEGLKDRSGEPRVLREQSDGRLADLRHVLTELDALDHLRVALLDALVRTPATHVDGACDAFGELLGLAGLLLGAALGHPALCLSVLLSGLCTCRLLELALGHDLPGEDAQREFHNPINRYISVIASNGGVSAYTPGTPAASNVVTPRAARMPTTTSEAIQAISAIPMALSQPPGYR